MLSHRTQPTRVINLQSSYYFSVDTTLTQNAGECEFLEDPFFVQSADVLLWLHSFSSRGSSAVYEWPPHLLWVFVHFEPPHRESINVQSGSVGANAFNWTEGYRLDYTLPSFTTRTWNQSTLSTWSRSYNAHLFLESPRRNCSCSSPRKPSRNGDPKPDVQNGGMVCVYFAAGKRRIEYALELSRHLQVDVFSREGTNLVGNERPLRCERWERTCYDMLARDYRFSVVWELHFMSDQSLRSQLWTATNKVYIISNLYEGCSKSFDVRYEANMVQGCNFI